MLKIKNSIDNIYQSHAGLFFINYGNLLTYVASKRGNLSEKRMLEIILETNGKQKEGKVKENGELYDQIFAYIRLAVTQEEDVILQFFLTIWQDKNYISDDAPELLIAACTAQNARPLKKNYQFPQTNADLIPLDLYPPVVEWCITQELALNNIRNALRQSQEEFFFLNELIKNSREAILELQKIKGGVGEIAINFFVDQKGCLIFIIRDNGKGMDQEDLNALFTPNYSTKNNAKNFDRDTNFGRGIFPSFFEFDEGLVKTRKYGHDEKQCLWSKK